MKRISALRTSSLVHSVQTAYWDFLRGKLPQFCFRWPIYDVWRYFVNREPKQLFRLEKARMIPSPVEARVIRDLRETGISMVRLDDLLPDLVFNDIQKWAQGLLREPATAETIKAIEGGARPDDAKSGKFYIVRPLGRVPIIDMRDTVMEMSLSEPILRIVCGYLGLLSRLAAVDLWYNIATDGPDEFSQRWHRDPEDRKIVKTFLYLCDVDETKGPFCYIPRTQNPGPLRQKIARLNYPNAGFIEKNFPPDLRQTCTGKAGTLIFCDTTGFHKGGHPTTGARFVFNAVYTTNASESLWNALKYFSLRGTSRVPQSPAASYAVGLAADRGR